LSFDEFRRFRAAFRRRDARFISLRCQFSRRSEFLLFSAPQLSAFAGFAVVLLPLFSATKFHSCFFPLPAEGFCSSTLHQPKTPPTARSLSVYRLLVSCLPPVSVTLARFCLSSPVKFAQCASQVDVATAVLPLMRDADFFRACSTRSVLTPVRPPGHRLPACSSLPVTLAVFRLPALPARSSMPSSFRLHRVPGFRLICPVTASNFHTSTPTARLPCSQPPTACLPGYICSQRLFRYHHFFPQHTVLSHAVLPAC